MIKKLTYPVRAMNSNVDGTVIVRFIINADGSVSDMEIFKSVKFSLDEESIQLIKQSPSWVPAEQNGKKVKSYKRQPITFKLGR